MHFVYTLVIFAYGGAVRFAALFNRKANLWVRGRKGLLDSLEAQLAQSGRGDTPLAWFHASSLGEFEQGRPIIEAYRRRWPEARIALSFFSPSGYEIRKNYDQADLVFYLPLDTPGNARRMLDILRPDKVFFIKYDFWFNLLAGLDRRKIPVYYISCLFRSDQYLFKWYGRWSLNRLGAIRHFFVQNRESALILAKAGFKNVTVTGDTRFDRVYDIARNPRPFPVIEKFAGNDPVWICGSTWPEDEAILFPVVRKLTRSLSPVESPAADNMILDADPGNAETAAGHHNKDDHSQNQGSPGDPGHGLAGRNNGGVAQPDLHATASSAFKVILAPHDTSEKRIREIMSGLDGKAIRLSQITESSVPDTNVLIVDSVGILSQLYQYATIAYIGGAFGSGLHNIQEPVTFGVPVFFGPRYHKFREAVDLVGRGGAFTITGSEQLEGGIRALMADPEKYQATRELCLRYVDENRGATARVMEWLEGVEE